MDIRGHVYVQGGTRGIGLELARQLAGRTMVESVTVSGRSTNDSPALNDLIRRSEGRVEALRVDLADESTIAAAATHVRAARGRLHVVLNVAGLLHAEGVRPERRVEDVSPEALSRVFTVNAFGPVLVAKHFAPLLRHEEPAVLANLSARVGSIGDNRLGGWYAYRASKAAQNQFTRCLSIELRRKSPQIVVVALHPGTVDTELSKPFQRGVKPDKLFSVERAAGQLLSVIEGLTLTDNGGFFAWDGQPIPW